MVKMEFIFSFYCRQDFGLKLGKNTTFDNIGEQMAMMSLATFQKLIKDFAPEVKTEESFKVYRQVTKSRPG